MAHIEKYNRAAVGHLIAHYDRQAENIGNESVDRTRSHLNYNLAAELQPQRQGDFIRKRCSEVKVQKRKDVNVMCTWVVTAPQDLPEAEQTAFFKAAFDFMAARYGQENVISAYVHMDETTPHMHFAFIPVVEDKKKGGFKVSAKERIDRNELRSFHYELEKSVSDALGHTVSILNGATKEGNKTIAEMKQKTAAKKVEIAEKTEKIADNRIKKAKERTYAAEQAAAAAEAKANKHEQKKEKLKAEKKQLQSDVDDLQKDISDAESHLKALQGAILTSQQVSQVSFKKTLTGAIKGISEEELRNLKATAAFVDEMKRKEKDFDKREKAAAAAEAKAAMANSLRKKDEEKAAELEKKILSLTERYDIAQKLAAEANKRGISSVMSREQIKKNAAIIHQKIEAEHKEQEQIRRKKGRSR